MTQTYEHIISHNNPNDTLLTQEFSVAQEYETEKERAVAEAARLALKSAQEDLSHPHDHPTQPLEGFSHLFEARFLFAQPQGHETSPNGSQLVNRFELSQTPEGALALIRELEPNDPQRDYIYSNLVEYYMNNDDLEFAHTLTKKIDDLALKLHMLTEIEARTSKAPDGLEETILSEVTNLVEDFTRKDLRELDQQELIALNDAADVLHNRQLQTDTQVIYREKYLAAAA